MARLAQALRMARDTTRNLEPAASPEPVRGPTGVEDRRSRIGVSLPATGPIGLALGRAPLCVITTVALNVDVDGHLDRLDAHTMCDATPQERDDGRREEQGASRFHRHSTWREGESSATTKTLAARENSRPGTGLGCHFFLEQPWRGAAGHTHLEVRMIGAAGRRGHRRRLGVLLGLGLALLGFFEIALPRLVERWLSAQLADRGVAISLNVVDVGLTRTTIQRISIPEQGIAIDEAILRYSLRDLLAGRIDTLEVGEARWALDINAMTAAAKLDEDRGAWPPPIGRIEMTSLSVTASDGVRAWESQWSGTVALESDGLEAEMRGSYRAGRLDLHVRSRGDALSYAVSGSEPSLGRVVASGTAALGRVLPASSAVIPFALDAEIEAPSLLARGAAQYGVSVEAPAAVRVSARGNVERLNERWAATVPAATLTAGASELARGPRHHLRDLALTLDLSGRADASGARLMIRPGSSITAQQLRSDDRALVVKSGARRAVALIVTRPAIAELRFDAARAPAVGAPGRWSVSAPSTRLRAEDLDVTTGDLHTVIADLDLPLWIESTATSTRAGFLAGGAIDTRTSQMRIGTKRIELDPIELLVRPSTEQGAYRSSDHHFRTELVSKRPFGARAGATASIRSMSIEARATLAHARPQLTSAVISAEAGRLRHEELEVARLTVRLPFRWSSDRRAVHRGALHLSGVQWGGHALAPLDGTLESRHARWHFVGSTSVPDGTPVSVRASTDPQRNAALVIDLESPRFEVQHSNRTGRLVKKLLGVDVDGTLAFDARLTFADGQVRSDAHLSLDEVAMVAEDRQFIVRGLSGDVRLSPPGATRSGGAQTLRWRSAEVGGQPLGRGAVHLIFPTWTTLHIDRAETKVGKGTLSLAPFTIDLTAPTVRTSVFMKGLDMRRWLPIASGGKLTGTGTFDGDVAVELSMKPRSLSLGKGQVETRGRGRLRVRDAALLRALASRAVNNVSSASVRDLIKERVVTALADFDYRSVSLELFDGSGTELTLVARGRGRRVAQEVKLTINATGVAAALAQIRPIPDQN